MKNDNETKIRYIMLTQMKGLGPVTQNALIDACGGINKCFEVDYEDLAGSEYSKKIGGKRISSFVLQRKDDTIRHRAEGILNNSIRAGIDIVVKEDRAFPYRFKNIDDIPIVL